MKTRTDFVSNSSSSSFILNGYSGCISLLSQKFAENFKEDEFPWDFDQFVTICIYVKNRDYVTVWKLLKDEECDFSEYYKDYRTGKTTRKDPDSLAWEGIKINIEDLLKISDYDIASKIVKMSFYSTDDNSTKCNRVLAMMYRLIDAFDCNPNCLESERDFLNDDSFYGKAEKIIASRGNMYK